MEEIAKLTSVDSFLSQSNVDLIDETVAAVFGIMLGFVVTPLDTSPPPTGPADLPDRTAIVGFSGVMRGSCAIRLSRLAAHAVASALLGGVPIEEGSEFVDDAVGELCNMLAGGWKAGVPELESHCLLSPPSVISGCDVHIHVPKASLSLTRRYAFDRHTLQVTMVHDRPLAA